MSKPNQQTDIMIGVGLRHGHYDDVLAHSKVIDFVEVHAENFFAAGGAAGALLEQVSENHPISLHATTLGLGSALGIPKQPVQNLKRLIERVSPVFVSDHACFAWSTLPNTSVHAGDLLPIAFNRDSLQVMVENVEHIQESIGRQLLVENLSAYLTPAGSNMDEVEFLVALCQRSGCRLLLDLNNLVVNATNAGVENSLNYVSEYLQCIPVGLVGEIHLAGCAPALPGFPMIDDHSQPVPEVVWDAYRVALHRFGSLPTLIEWDTDLPSWDVLTDEAVKARAIVTQELIHECA
jgi:uncharacterized protein (UPF0276 family)